MGLVKRKSPPPDPSKPLRPGVAWAGRNSLLDILRNRARCDGELDPKSVVLRSQPTLETTYRECGDGTGEKA